MNVSDESQVLSWFERSLEQPAAGRIHWLVEQRLPAWLHDRVQRLVEAEDRLNDDFLEPSAGPATLHAPAELPQPGQVIGRYEVIREIDAGGMGIVYLARRADRSYEQQVAIKVIRPGHLSAGPSFRRSLIARFENERALLARLTHRNIARILDGGTSDAGLPYLVMEYVQGESLLAYCDRHQLDIPARIDVFRKVCDGVQEAHRHLIVHRDLKPENILVTADGEPRLLDFGIARTLEGAEPPDSNATMLTAMTPAYASPEQVRREALTTSSDVYSLGVVLFQLLAGMRPYELGRLTPAEAERVVMESTPLPLRTALMRSALPEAERARRRPQITADLDRILAKAMHKEANRRYASAQELADELGRFLEGRPILAHPDSLLYRAGKFVSRHRAGSALGSVALVAVLAATGVAFWQANQSRQAARDMKSINSFLLDVLQMSDPFDAGSELTLSAALDRAAELIDTRFAARPDLSAEIRFGIGYSMVSRYRLESAQKQLDRALAESRSEFGDRDIRTLRVVEGLAGLRQEQGRPQDAQKLFESGIAGIEKAGLQADPLYVDLLGNLGNLFLVQERYPEAQRYLEKARDAANRQSSGKLTLDGVNLISNLAHAAHGLDQLERADALYAQAQKGFETLYPNGNPDLAILLNNRALLAEDRGRPREALALHEKSLAIRRRVFGGDHPAVVVALGNDARMAVTVGEAARALPIAEEATSMADRVYKEPIGRHAYTYATLAQVRLANGDIDGAVTAWARASELLMKTQNAPPSTAQYLERVRASICARSRAPYCGVR